MLWLQRSHFDVNRPWEDVNFHLLAAFDVVGAPGWCMEAPHQPFSEFWLILQGECEIVQGDLRTTARSGDIVMLREGLPRRTYNPLDKPLCIVGFSYQAKLFGTIDFLTLLNLPLCQASPLPQMEEWLRHIVEHSRAQRVESALLAQGWSQLVLGETLQATRAASGGSDVQQLRNDLRSHLDADVVRAIEYIARHYTEPIESADVAKAVHLSAKHLARKFKAAIGSAPSDYLRDFRLQRAREQLASSQQGVTQVAHACGFHDAAYFSRVFKARFSLSPLDYRRQLHAMTAYTADDAATSGNSDEAEQL